MRNNQSPYHKRVAHRLDMSRQQQQKYQNNRHTQIDCFMVQFEYAYKEYYRDEANLQYRHGWYFLHGRRYRHSDMEKSLALLLARIQELESPNPDEEYRYVG